ncbi:MAG: glycosyltransferase family 9 protein [Desulfovibrio sp.]|jgi:ADP-heptose:LPS heptosyltransferase|nr:glycosyltransferase family 9 protein [Desulfovibrio sp.]
MTNTGRRPPDHWLAVRTGHLGDVVLTTGVLAWLGETRGWTFDVLTSPPFEELFAGHPHVRRVLALDSRQGIARLFRICGDLASERRGWGLLDLHGSLRARILASRWRGPVARYRKMALTRRFFLLGNRFPGLSPLRGLSRSLTGLSVPQRYALAVCPAAPPSPRLLLPRVFPAPAELQAARERLGAIFRRSGQPPVALHPQAAHPLKAWPPRHYAALVQALDQRGIPWICLGQGTALFPDRAEDLTGRTSLRETCALLSLCRCLISGDSGPLHLAAAVGAPVVGLFGPTTREWGFYPAGERDKVLELPLPCRPCSLHGQNSCPRSGECLAGIAPAQVLREVENFPPGERAAAPSPDLPLSRLPAWEK